MEEPAPAPDTPPASQREPVSPHAKPASGVTAAARPRRWLGRRWLGRRWFRRLATVGLALATVAIAGLLAIWYFEIDFQDRPTRIVLKYASEHRQTDLRFPGASYRPIRTVRGAQEDYDFSAAELADLEEELRVRIAERPGDSEALFAMAEVCLVRLQPLQAIDILERLRLFSPKDAKLLGALAYAHYLRARMTRQTPDLLRSVDLFEKALESAPDDPVLLFNAGTAAQRANLSLQAKARYERFLELETGTGWAVEARVRLRELGSMVR